MSGETEWRGRRAVGGARATPAALPSSGWLEREIAPLALGLGSLALRAKKKIPRRRGNSAKAERALERFYERVWREAAADVGGEVEELSGGVLEIRLGEVAVRVHGPLSPIDDQVTLDVAGNKPLVYRLLIAEGVPVPEHRAFAPNEFARAHAFLSDHGGPCVVKPAVNGYAGRAVTTGITSRLQLLRAVAVATGGRAEALIEEEVPGRNFRILLFDGELLDVVERRPPTVVGDGVSTVRTLVERENARRRGVETEGMIRQLSIDLDMRHTLSRQSLGLGATPPQGRRVVVKTAINQNAADENAAANGILCQEIIEHARVAAMAVKAQIAGVDIVTTDPSVPLATAGGVVLEVNTTPGLHIHHHRSAPTFPATTEILRRLLERERRGGGLTV